MARAGMDPAAAAERLGHTGGGALFLRRYRHMYDDEKRLQATPLDSFMCERLDAAWRDEGADLEGTLSEAAAESGRNLSVRKARERHARTTECLITFDAFEDPYQSALVPRGGQKWRTRSSA